MNQDQFNNKINSGEVSFVDPKPPVPPPPPLPPLTLEQYVAILQTLRNPAQTITTPPTAVPKTLVDSIKFYDDGTKKLLYLYIHGAWISLSAGGPGGGDKDIQVNNAGVLDGDDTFMWDKLAGLLSVTGGLGNQLLNFRSGIISAPGGPGYVSYKVFQNAVFTQNSTKNVQILNPTNLNNLGLGMTVFVESRIVASRETGGGNYAGNGAFVIQAVFNYSNLTDSMTLVGSVNTVFNQYLIDAGTLSVNLVPSGNQIQVQVTSASDNGIGWHATTIVQIMRSNTDDPS